MCVSSGWVANRIFETLSPLKFVSSVFSILWDFRCFFIFFRSEVLM